MHKQACLVAAVQCALDGGRAIYIDTANALQVRNGRGTMAMKCNYFNMCMIVVSEYSAVAYQKPLNGDYTTPLRDTLGMPIVRLLYTVSFRSWLSSGRTQCLIGSWCIASMIYSRSWTPCAPCEKALM